ncbi:MAG: RNA methyltransferase [Thermoplasmata archaeon]|nr:RNA methyltransferase [Thermoplasmata archaeon]
MPDIRVILVEPKFPGNIGSVCRAMSNFGLDELVMVNPCDLGDDAFRYAKHGRFVLDKAKTVKKLDTALKGLDLIVATTGRPTGSDKKFLREPITPRQFAEKYSGTTGKIGILFGREDYGLYNEELKNCDVLVTIPTHEINPIMNLSHACTVVFYELYAHGQKPKRKKLAGSTEKEALNKIFSELLDEITYAPHKKAKTRIMFRKIIARSGLSTWEFHTLAGVFSRATKSVRRYKVGKD